MKISVRVKAGARVEKVEKVSGAGFTVFVRAQATEGKANKAVIESLSDYFDLPKSRISILKGQTSKHKIVEIV